MKKLKYYQNSRTIFLEWITCPKCGKKGSLCARLVRRKTHWHFKAYVVLHKKFSPKKYQLVRSKGLTSRQARGKGVYFNKSCNLGIGDIKI